MYSNKDKTQKHYQTKMDVYLSDKNKKYVQLTPIFRKISPINFFHARFHFFSYRFTFCFHKIYIFIQKPGQACFLESPFQRLLECLLNNIMNLGFLLEPSHQHIAGSHPVKCKITNLCSVLLINGSNMCWYAVSFENKIYRSHYVELSIIYQLFT